jgi:hypothetical protein
VGGGLYAGGSRGPAGSYELLEAPDPSLLPSLLCVAMERLGEELASRWLGQGGPKGGGRSGSPNQLLRAPGV